MDINEIILGFVVTVLNKPSVTVIYKHPTRNDGDKVRAVAAPPKPYATVKIPTRQGLGFPVSEALPQGNPVTSVDQVVAKVKLGQCEVIFYSNELFGEFAAENLAEYFETALGFDRAINYQIDNNFGVLDIRPARNIDINMGDLIERRQMVEFSINYVHELVETDVGYFDHAEATLIVEE